MPITSFTVESYGLSDLGLHRPNNEDVWAELPALKFYALADGMGGHQAGEVASKETILYLCDAIDAFFAKKVNPAVDEVASALKQMIVDANSWIRNLSKQHPELSGMGTTLCCCLVYENNLIYAHVGDSRIYHFNRTLTQLTQDHSLRQELLAKGNLDPKKAPSFHLKNIITRAIGTSSHVQPEVHIQPLKSGDQFILCSDGLSDYVSSVDIAKILQKKTSLKKAAIELIEQAKNNDGSDNITVLIIKIVNHTHETHLFR